MIFLQRYLAALVYNLAIPVIQVRLDALGDQTMIQQRDRELHGFIDALVRLKMQDLDVITVDWQGEAGRTFVRERPAGGLRAIGGRSMTSYQLRTERGQAADPPPTVLLDWFGSGSTIQYRGSLRSPPGSATLQPSTC